MNEIEKLLKNLNPSVISKIQSFAGSDEGKKLISKFGNINKDELIKKVSSMSDEEKRNLIAKLENNPSLKKTIEEMF